MKTLREEIGDIIQHTIIGRYVGVNEDIIKKSVFIDEILKLIEKRIDSIIELHRKDKFGYFKVGEYDKAQSHLISQTFWKEVKELLK